MNSLILISPSLVRGFQPILSGKLDFLTNREGAKSAKDREEKGIKEKRSVCVFA